MKKRKIAVFAAAIAMMLVMTTVVSAYDLPQKYSSDDYTSPAVEVEIPPEPKEQKSILTYLNAEEMNMKAKPQYKKGTLYVPAKEFFLRAGLSVKGSGKITVSNDKVTAVFKSGSNKVTINGEKITLGAKVKRIKGVVMCPAELIAEVLNAKVWYDEFSKTFAVSTGSFKDDGILRIINYKFWMDGEPYYEISFNKYDLFQQVASYFSRAGEWDTEAATLPAATEAIEQLASLGFKTIRSFDVIPQRAAYFRSEKQKNVFYEIMDTVFDLCDKNGIKVNCCLALPSTDFCAKGEDYFDLVCNRDSQSRQNLYQFLEEYITKYKDRDSVLMWEIVNEGNLDADVGWAVSSARPSLYQLGQFYTDVAKKIKEIDPDHLVTGGDSCFRASQWHQYLGVKEGKIGVDWTRDTLEDRMKAYVMLYSGLDVISMHCYSTGLGASEYAVSDTDDTKVKEDFNLYMQECRRMGKVFYNGETAVNADTYNEEIYRASLEYIQSIIDAGVQISHWWTFRSDSKTHKAEGYGWVISDGELLEAIIAGNKQLKETYVINATANPEKASVWNEEDAVISGEIAQINDSDVKGGCASFVGGGAFVYAAVLCIAVLMLRRKENA